MVFHAIFPWFVPWEPAKRQALGDEGGRDLAGTTRPGELIGSYRILWEIYGNYGKMYGKLYGKIMENLWYMYGQQILFLWDGHGEHLMDMHKSASGKTYGDTFGT